ncbi:DUF6314 family protein [Litchfieldella rifensis]|uniref:DUF6314 family protein n=1 Tax=Litchfieldella rifensis TaxID=762643 RepID=A0ABV7LLN9_9GAMM
MTAIIRFKPLLTTIHRVDFSSRPGTASRSGWSGHGHGSVQVESRGDTVRFFERGHFLPTGQSREVPFTNVYRWEFSTDRLRLFHERRGADHAVWLFDLGMDDASGDLLSLDAHLCGADRYQARLTPLADGFDLQWRITGPRKEETLRYRYRRA